MNRRNFLSHSLWAGTGLATMGCQSRSAAARTPARTGSGRIDLRKMAETVLATPRGKVPELALKWAADGATFRDLLGAAYLAGLREIDPSPIGGPVHAIMMVASCAEAGAVLRGRRKLLPALFNLDRVKRGQQSDARGADWVMPDAPEPASRSVEENKRILAVAMRDWDTASGDRAVVGLHGALPMDAFFEQLWPWALRDFRVIGHKIIFATQSYRALQEVGWRHGLDAVRSVAFGVLDKNPFNMHSAAESKQILALFDQNKERSHKMPQTWQTGRSDPDASFALAAELRGADLGGACDAVVAHARKGVGADSLWDGLRLRAFEMLMQAPSTAGVHTVTSVNALHRTSRITNVDQTRRLCLLQAAGWLRIFAPILRQRARSRRDVTIDKLQAPRGKTKSDPFSAAELCDRVDQAVGQLRAGNGATFTARAMDVLARKARNEHDYKYSVAAVEEIGAAHPRCRPYLAGAGMEQLRCEEDRDWAGLGALRKRFD